MSQLETNIQRLKQHLTNPGRHTFPFFNSELDKDVPFALNTYRAASYQLGQPVIFVQHGMLRNGDDYRDFWIPAADKYGLLIIAPTFDDTNWATPENYNNGRAYLESGEARPLSELTYALIHQVKNTLELAQISDGQKTYLFGHSAGGQFSHRYQSTQAHVFDRVAPSNAGWYSLPTLDLPFPEGLGGIGVDDDQVEKLLAYPMMILAGDQDIATNEASLPAEPAAKRQGPHRFARAQYYYEFGKQEATKRGVPFNWTLQVVPGIGHDGCAMSEVCAHLWVENGLPSAERLEQLAQSYVA